MEFVMTGRAPARLVGLAGIAVKVHVSTIATATEFVLPECADVGRNSPVTTAPLLFAQRTAVDGVNVCRTALVHAFPPEREAIVLLSNVRTTVTGEESAKD